MNTTALPQQSLDAARRAAASPRAAGLAGALLALLLGWQAAAIALRMLPDAPASRAAERDTVAVSAGGDGEQGDPNARVAELHLFGEPPDEGSAQGSAGDAESPTDAPETQLNLTLKGVYAPGSGEGLAIIASGGGPEKVFAVGDTIAGNARITGIYSDRVVLNRGGRAETLRMSVADAAPERTRRSSSRGSASAKERRIAERASQLRQRLLENPVELARMVRFQPYVRNGDLVGYRVQPRAADAQLLSELGLRPSDVITELNGRSLNNPRQANQALQSLRDARTIDVTFLRNGQQQQLSIPIGGAG